MAQHRLLPLAEVACLAVRLRRVYTIRACGRGNSRPVQQGRFSARRSGELKARPRFRGRGSADTWRDGCPRRSRWPAASPWLCTHPNWRQPLPASIKVSLCDCRQQARNMVVPSLLSRDADVIGGMRGSRRRTKPHRGAPGAAYKRAVGFQIKRALDRTTGHDAQDTPRMRHAHPLAACSSPAANRISPFGSGSPPRDQCASGLGPRSSRSRYRARATAGSPAHAIRNGIPHLVVT